MTPTASDVQRTLALLGDSPAAIAETLANKGVTGEREGVASCPLAMYLRTEYGSAWVVYVGRAVARVDRTAADLTDAQAEFVDQFDVGMFPELIA